MALTTPSCWKPERACAPRRRSGSGACGRRDVLRVRHRIQPIAGDAPLVREQPLRLRALDQHDVGEPRGVGTPTGGREGLL